MLIAVSVGTGLHTAAAGPNSRRPRAQSAAADLGGRARFLDARVIAGGGWGRTFVELASMQPPATRPIEKAATPTPAPARVRPVDGAITSTFGEPRPGGPHPGVDLDGETGDPIRAAAAGTIITAGPAAPGWGGYGTIVLIDHGGGVQSLYAHLSTVSALPGQTVAPGMIVGAMGTSGFATGSHLHFEVRLTGQPIDPLAWLAAPAN